MAGGWLICALAVVLGAPFWFDLLNKVMVIRATVKPREKSQEEGSEDRPTSTPQRPVRGGGAGEPGPQAASASAGAAPQIPFEPRRWQGGTEEGDL